MADDKAGNAALSERLLSEEINPEAEIVADSETERGVKQEPAYRDLWAAILFGVKQAVIFYLAFAWGAPNLKYEYKSYGSSESIQFTGILWLSVVTGLISLIFSIASLSVLVRLGEQLIQITLIVSLSLSGLMVFLFMLEGYWWATFFSTLILLWGLLYTRAIWRRIPFAAANLKAAISALQMNSGISFVALATTIGMFIWSFVWVLALLGVYVRSASCQDGTCSAHIQGLVLCFFILSYYWTASVINNILHVTVAGLVGTWVFSPIDACQFCSPAIGDSFVRASTYSFGSVCLGSLVAAVLQTLYLLLNEARRNGRSGHLLLCVLECIVGCLERLVSYFNRYTLVYVGLWGYDYLTAGKRVMELFSRRGWTTIINDQLVLRVLSWVTLILGGFTGFLGLLIASLRPSWVEEFGDAKMFVAFMLPATIGSAIAMILSGTVSSAVDTIVVAFAEAPRDFELNHPGLHMHMIEAWRRVYPDEFRM